jgi:hypothetical protein
MKSTTPREAKFERGERLVAGVAQAIRGIDANDRLWVRNESNTDVLLLDGVARAEGNCTTGANESCNREQRNKQDTLADEESQNTKIVMGKRL